jgi:hypothetical protein
MKEPLPHLVWNEALAELASAMEVAPESRKVLLLKAECLVCLWRSGEAGDILSQISGVTGVTLDDEQTSIHRCVVALIHYFKYPYRLCPEYFTTNFQLSLL